MANADVQVPIPGSRAAPLDYRVPDSVRFLLKSVRASFDGSGAGGNFLPAVELVAPGGASSWLVAADTAVVAGDSADVTFAPFLRNAPAAATPGISQIFGFGSIYNATGLAQTIPNAVFTQLTLAAQSGPAFGDGAKVEFGVGTSSVRFNHSTSAGNVKHLRLAGVWAASAATKILQLRFAGINGAFYDVAGLETNATYRPSSTVTTDTGYQELITFVTPFTYMAGGQFDVTAWAYQASGGNLDFTLGQLEVIGEWIAGDQG